MFSFDDVGSMLDDIADSLPDEFNKELNGGINLLPNIKEHPVSVKDSELYILGEYHNEQLGLGRYINIYYGSLMKIHSHLQPEQLKKELRRILLHEFTHHLESLAGEKGLEIKDAQDLQKYLHRFNAKK